MIKLKDLIKENDCECGGDCCSTKESITENKNLKREFGEPLPTLSSVMKNHQKDKTVVTEQTEKKVADAITRYLIGDRKQAIRQLAMLASKINVDIDQERYNSQYGDTHRAIMKVTNLNFQGFDQKTHPSMEIVLKLRMNIMEI